MEPAWHWYAFDLCVTSPLIISLILRFGFPSIGQPWTRTGQFFAAGLTGAIFGGGLMYWTNSDIGAGFIIAPLATIPIGIVIDIISRHRLLRKEADQVDSIHRIDQQPYSQDRIVTLSQSEYMRLSQETSSAYSGETPRNSDR